MKTFFKRIISLTLSVLMIALIIFVQSIAVYAVTTFTYGDFEFAVGEESGTCLVYSYIGSDTEVVLPETVYSRRVIGVYNECFKGSNLTSVTIPNSYTLIGDSAFYNCQNLSTVTLPANLTSLGRAAFAKCTSLTSVNMENCDSLTELAYAAFSDDSMMNEVIFPKNLEKISEYAFSGTALSTMDIPDGVTVVENNAFENCGSLVEVNFPESLVEISDSTFRGCAIESLTFPDNLVTIGNYAFADNISLNAVDISPSVKTIGIRCFNNDISLLKVFIPETVTTIGYKAFADMESDGTIEIICYENSQASDYCAKNNVSNCKVVEKLLGDSDLNGEVNILDVTCIQKYKIGEDTLPTYRAKNLADVNRDGAITIRDATLIQMYLAKIITKF
jgi:hypothetical protein